jgi:translation initiation factor RLI1
LAEVYTALGSGSGIEFLVAQTRDLVDGFDELRGFLEAFERLLFGSSEEDLWRFISDVILQEGDLAVLDYLKP